MGDHKRSKRFRDDSFDYQILESSTNRSYIEQREEYWIAEKDTYKSGLNETIEGKGWGHNSTNFTTRGFIFSDESRKKMSESAKKRGGGPEQMRKLSKYMWADPKMRKHHSEIRKGKRLCPPKLSDDDVSNMRALWEDNKKSCIEEANTQNEKGKKLGWRLVTAEGIFYKKFKDLYDVSRPTIINIIKNKCRTKILPAIYKS